MRLDGKKIHLQPLKEKDLPTLHHYLYGEEQPEWKKWDAPYFEHKQIDYETFYQKNIQTIQETKPNRLGIFTGNQLIGTVGFYWEHEPSRWLEAGITIFDPNYWNGGYGTEALSLWVDYIFQQYEVARVGITTWSGNHRMMKAAEKIGMILEGRMRKCRYYNGEYYDSIRMGVLREEWQSNKIPNNTK
ncbi:GNAT family N-acetyltransferase [Bacillus sp. 2205SS5-2]|uniref:GNAT family N-acetyltransferase n=1 Tax=Bacillus sp. 2205SS5-2 TaxID=3109031 RepID=UPI0030071FB7